MDLKENSEANSVNLQNGCKPPCENGSQEQNEDVNPDEVQYLNLIRLILEKGNQKNDRTRVGTRSLFGHQMRFNLRNGIIPLLTTKRVAWKTIIRELLWFIRGSTNAKELAAEGVKIWDGNSSRQFLDSLGFTDREEGDLGPVYGFQWRHSGAKYENMNSDYTGKGIDQLQEVINRIKSDPDDRRMIVCSWNPVDIGKMALPPCHCLIQFYVSDGELSCQFYQRSADMGLGVPFNIASYAFLTYMVAHITNLKPGDLIHTLGDCHVYNNHIEPLQKQLNRKVRPFPTLKFKRNVTSIEDFKLEDFEISNYNPHPIISMEMAV